MNKLALFLLFFAAYFPLNAQVLTGVITDESGTALKDAVIYTKNYRSHTHSNIEGKFEISSAVPGDSLHVQFIGFEKFSKLLNAKDFNNPLLIEMKEADFLLDQIFIDNSLRSVNHISRIDLAKNPVNSSQEVLRQVPGLFIAQHAGGGKAEQIFLRGFDIDHGTDIAINVDGMPVNMVSHAHGQGYADLHFLIPETIEKIDFGKGSYYADKGNFNTAGYVDFKTKSKIDKTQIGLDIGEFNTLRSLVLLPLVNTENNNAYIASEYMLSDGPFEASQNFNRLNLMGKYIVSFNENNTLELSASSFRSKWDASGQIPVRLVEDGTISRFGAVDPTEGGNTSRTNLTALFSRVLDNNSLHTTRLYFIDYDFELYSNFTFFLNDPVNGDQIRQKEKRKIFGFESRYLTETTWGNTDVELNAGIGMRYDDIDESELSRTKNRQETLERTIFGETDETNLYAFIENKYRIGHLTLNPSLRVDHLRFQYNDQLAASYSNEAQSRTIVLPKLNILYNLGFKTQFYLKSGRGFHSNDSRVITSGEADAILPAAYSFDLGTIWKPMDNIWLNAAVWMLFLEQEFVYVGDEGVVEPSGRTNRKGIDLGLRIQANPHLYFYSDFNYTIARSIDEPEGLDFIPLAPDMTATAGVSYNLGDKLNIGLNSRFLKDRPANEDNSIVAEGFFITDFNLQYALFNNVKIGLVVENLFDSEWNEAQFATLSKLASEVQPVEEIHFTPGVPRFAKLQLRYSFN